MIRLFTLLFLAMQAISCSTTVKSFSCSKTEPKRIKAVVTAYAAVEDSKYRNKSAIGHPLIVGKSIATDWSKIPVGTVLKFNGNNYTVHDYGTALCRKTDKPIIDLYVPNRKAIKNWGKREMDVEVVKWGSYEESKKILSTRLAYRHCREMYNNID